LGENTGGGPFEYRGEGGNRQWLASPQLGPHHRWLSESPLRLSRMAIGLSMMLSISGRAITGLLAAAPDEVADNDAKPDRKNKRGGEIVFHGFLHLLRRV
jgi:hypothetical protein